MRSEGQLSLDDKGGAMSEKYIMIMMVLGALSFDTSNPRLQHFSVHASSAGTLNQIARSDG